MKEVGSRNAEGGKEKSMGHSAWRREQSEKRGAQTGSGEAKGEKTEGKKVRR
jgi:hypothetical protein